MKTLERIDITETSTKNKEPFIQDIVRYRFACEYLSGGNTLDIACGTGYGTRMLSDLGGKVIGVDISEEAVGLANSYYSRESLFFTVGSATKLPLGNNTQDVIISFETIEHLPEPAIFLNELIRVIRPRGTVIISTPLNESISRFRPVNPFHLREYSSIEFKTMISNTFGDKFTLYSQITISTSDPFVDNVERYHAGRILRRVLRWLIPTALRRSIRNKLRLEGLSPKHSEIVEGSYENAHVQIVVIHM